MSDFRFGILGCGFASQIHAAAIKETDGACLCGAFDTNEERKHDFCRLHQTEAFPCIEQLLNSDHIDAVCICLPSGLHYAAAMECIRHQKHVVIEKPMALTSSQAEDIIRAAEEYGVTVCVISQLRYSPSSAKIKAWIDQGKLGTITIGNAIMKYWRSTEYYESSPWHGTLEMDGGGALMNQGIHGVDLLQYFMGKVVSVFAYSKTLVHDIETEDTLTAVLEYESGAIGTIQATTSVYPGYDRQIEICGSKGSLVLREDRIEICDVEGETVLCDAPSSHNTSSDPQNLDCTLHKAQIQEFIQCVKAGKQPSVHAAEGKKAVDIILAIYQSAKTGQKIYLS